MNVRRRFNYRKNKKGFTIVEAITSLLIISLCSVALFSSLYAGFHLVNDIRENVVASSIIQEKIEELRKSFFSQLPSYGQSSFSNEFLSTLYNASGTIKADQYIDADIVRICVTVTWYSRLKAGKENKKRAVTLITKNGINSI